MEFDESVLVEYSYPNGGLVDSLNGPLVVLPVVFLPLFPDSALLDDELNESLLMVKMDGNVVLSVSTDELFGNLETISIMLGG